MILIYTLAVCPYFLFICSHSNCLNSVTVTCERSRLFQPLQRCRLWEFTSKKQQPTVTVHMETFDFRRLHNELSSSLCCGNNSPPARSLGAISSIHCHHHNLTWCGNYAMKSFFSHSTLFGACCRAEQLYGFDRFSKRVNQSMIENCHQVWFFKWKYYTSLDRIITSLGNKVGFFFLLFFLSFFFYLLSFCCKEIQFDYMLLYLCITQHLKENFKLC